MLFLQEVGRWAGVCVCVCVQNLGTTKGKALSHESPPTFYKACEHMQTASKGTAAKAAV